MRTIETIAYQFDELSEDAKQKALNNLWDVNLYDSWWENIYEDANAVDLSITGFDIGRGNDISIDFKHGAEDTARAILKNHGDVCDTYKLAKEFLEEYEDAQTREGKYSELIEGIEYGTEDEEEQRLEAEYEELREDAEEEMEELANEFLRALGEEYLGMLKEDYEYRGEEEAIIEAIEANEYEFTEEGEQI